MKERFVQLLKKLTLNQNFLWLIFAYFGVWFADSNELDCLCKASWIIFLLIGISVIICLIFYTIDYCRKKWPK